MRTFPFICLVVAITITAAYQIIAGKTPGAAPPEAAAGDGRQSSIVEQPRDLRHAYRA
jgi:hypothetical protein